MVARSEVLPSRFLDIDYYLESFHRQLQTSHSPIGIGRLLKVVLPDFQRVRDYLCLEQVSEVQQQSLHRLRIPIPDTNPSHG